MTWTPDTLKEHYDALLEERAKRAEERHRAMTQSIRDALSAADKATSKAEDATKERFAGVNEFRGALEDAERTKYPRKEAEAQIAALSARIATLETARTGEAGQQIGTKSGYLWAIGVVAVIATILGMFLSVLVKGGAP